MSTPKENLITLCSLAHAGRGSGSMTLGVGVRQQRRSKVDGLNESAETLIFSDDVENP